MSLEVLFQQILLTEQYLTEKTRQIQEAKVSIIRYQEKIKACTERYEEVNKELDQKAQELCEMRIHQDLAMKHEEQMEKQIEELLCQQNRLNQHLDAVRLASAKEQERFQREIVRFNSDFDLRGNRETVFESQTQSEILELQQVADSLHKEMELMSQSNRQMNSTQEEKIDLQLELQGLEKITKDLDSQLTEAKTGTESLRSESLMVRQKSVTDGTCQRLKTELEMYKKGEEEGVVLRDALSAQIQLLQSKLDDGQGTRRCSASHTL